MNDPIVARVGDKLKHDFEEALLDSSLTKSVVIKALAKKFVERREETIGFLFNS